jgi:hypothetical protein
MATASPTGAQFIPPFPAELLTSFPVTPKMNRASFNAPAAGARELARARPDYFLQNAAMSRAVS